MPELVLPTACLHAAFLECRDEWGPGFHEDGFGLGADDDAGQIGYGVRPSARRRGLANWALGEMLKEARALGLERVLVHCLTGNIASARTIERNGGVLEGIRDTKHGRRVRRYWIPLDR